MSKPQYDVGLHRGKITDHGLATAGTGTPQAFIKFTVSEVKDGDEWHPVTTPRERTVFMAITEKTIEFIVEAFETIGFVGGSFSAFKAKENPEFSLVGERREFWCKHDVYKGDTNERWNVSTPKAAAPPMDKKDVRQLDSLFGSALKKARPAATAQIVPPHAASTVDSATQITDDDIPF